jgi:hypothetical protein
MSNVVKHNLVKEDFSLGRNLYRPTYSHRDCNFYNEKVIHVVLYPW